MIWKTMEVTFQGRHCETPTVVCTSQYLEKPRQVTAHTSFLKTHAGRNGYLEKLRQVRAHIRFLKTHAGCSGRVEGGFTCRFSVYSSQCSQAKSEGARILAIYT